MLKRLSVAFLAVILCLQLIACGRGEDDNTLRIYGLYVDYKADPYLKSYQEKNPDVYVSVESGMDVNNSQMGDEGPTEALKKLNTRLLAEDGPDVILMDDINAEKYIEAGLLADITDIAEENENLTDSIVESSCYEKDGKIYTIPAAFSLMTDTVRTGENVDFSSARAFTDSIKAQGLNNSLSYDNEAGLWYRREIDPLIKKEGKISREKLQEFFTALDDLEDYEPGEYWRACFVQSNLSVNPLSNYYGIVNGQSFFEKDGIHRVDATTDYVQNFKTLQEIYHYREKGEFSMNYWKNEEGYYYIPMLNLAINKHSKKKGLAEDFVRYLLSDEGQQIARENHYLPVSSKVTLDEMNQTRKATSFYTGEPDNMKAEQVSGFTDEIIDEVEAIFASLNQPLTADSHLMEIIMQGAMTYINRQSPLDEALDNTLNKLDIYLAE